MFMIWRFAVPDTCGWDPEGCEGVWPLGMAPFSYHFTFLYYVIVGCVNSSDYTKCVV